MKKMINRIKAKLPLILMVIMIGVIVLRNPMDPISNGLQSSQSATNGNYFEPLRSYDLVSPIVITNNSELADAADSGFGTWAEPFIIENKEINTVGEYSLQISNTNVPLIIRNCIFYWSTEIIASFTNV